MEVWANSLIKRLVKDRSVGDIDLRSLFHLRVKGSDSMKCPRCGTDNEAGFRFCVKCGVNLEDPQDINIEQLDMGGYYSEEDSASGSFTFGSGTFTISDTPSNDSSSDLYTAAELNDTDEEFDFSSFDEPFIPKLDTGRVTLPEQTRAVRQAQMNNANQLRQQSAMQGIPAPNGMPGIPQPVAMQGIPAAPSGMQSIAPQGGMQGVPAPSGMQSIAPQGGMQGISAPSGMQGIPQPAAMQGVPAQNGGSQANGMPVYGQPVMYGQPQLIGYDQNGMPLYGQPLMYNQPQLIGYDQNGMPVYGQPVMYAQPQIIGCDQNGMPVYGQPVVINPAQAGELADIPVVPAMGGIPVVQPMGGNMQMNQPVPPPVEDKNKVEVPDDFWEFFDGGKATEHAETDPTDDFFGKRNEDLGSLKRPEKKKVSYMNDTPLVDASKLKKNEESKYNKMFMRSAEVADPSALEAKKEQRRFDYMGSTKAVDASELRAKEERKSWNVMSSAGMADPSELQANTKQRTGSMMAQADHAVQAMPKKAKTYNDEIDAIELPEEMKAKKTNKTEIPGLPEF